jgi:hypothetical protein
VKNDKAKLMDACDRFTKQLEHSSITLTRQDDGTFSKPEGE